MELQNQTVFSDPESFEEYYASIAGRLKVRRDERLAFISREWTGWRSCSLWRKP